jgi:hypothetical protein
VNVAEVNEELCAIGGFAYCALPDLVEGENHATPRFSGNFSSFSQ